MTIVRPGRRSTGMVSPARFATEMAIPTPPSARPRRRA